MRRCRICEGLLHDCRFPKTGGPICKLCVNQLMVEYGVDYAPPEKKSVAEAYADLLSAIREQSIAEGAHAEFEAYWINRPIMQTIWSMLLEVHDANIERQNNLRTALGRNKDEVYISSA